LLGNVSRHQPLPTNADQPVASSAYITVDLDCRNDGRRIISIIQFAEHGKY
jgi:hypothetical protein